MSEFDVMLSRLRGEGIQLWAEQDQIKFRAPGGLAAETVAWLKERKTDILALLRRQGFISQALCEGRLAAHRLSRAPLSAEQMRLWLSERLGQLGATYHIPFKLNFQGVLDEQALERALQQMVQRHESLRTLFVDEDDTVFQLVLPADAWRLQKADVSELGDADEAALGQLDALFERPFDLRREVPFRALLLKQGSVRFCLAVCIHHLAADGWSMAVFMHELVQLYRQSSGADALPLAEPGPQYIDYTLWQRVQDLVQPDEPLQAFWKRQLEDAPATSGLAPDRPRAQAPGARGAELPFALDAQSTAALRKLAKARGTTLFNLLLGAYSLLLYRWTGQTDLMIGTPTAGRPLPQMERMIGMFVNLLPLRVRVKEGASFGDLLQCCVQTTSESFSHQALSFERMARLAPQRSNAAPLLFQMALALETVPAMPSLGEHLTVELARVSLPISRFDLTLFIQDGGDALTGYAEYSTALFEAETVRQWLASLAVVLRHVAQAPETSIDQVPLMDAAAWRQVVTDWNRTEHAFPHERCLHQLIEAQVDRTPDAVALRFGERVMSYAELDRAANQLAHHLASMSVGPDRLVGVCLERSFDMMVALLAVLKAGGAYVPLDPSYPAQRLHDMCSDAAPVLVLTWRRFAAQLATTAAPLLFMDTMPAEWAALDTGRLHAAVQPRHLAYVIYTSGSTGKPKGAANIHRAVVNRIDWMRRHYGFDERDRLLQKTPYGFDVSVWELFLGLCCGAELVIAEPELHKDPVRLAGLIYDRQVSVIHFVPSMLEVFLDMVAPASVRSLRLVFCSGEALKPGTRDRFLSRHDAELHNLYGPTEAAVDVSYHHCQASEGPVVPIGRPISNARLYVLDAHMQAVPVGVAGQLHIGGPVLARGYYNKPELTAASFVPDPFSADPEARLYKTGDLARWRADGALEYLGRLDGQVKLRGQRLELGEIESTLMEDSRVGSAVAFLSTQGAEPQLIAACVPSAAYRSKVRGQPRHALPNGMAVLCQSAQVAEYLYREMYVDHVYLRHGITLKQARCVLDVGANIGMFSLRAAELAPDARVFAFEPIPSTFEMLRENCALYAPGAVAFSFGLGAGEQEVSFSHYPDLPLMSGRYADPSADLCTASTFAANLVRDGSLEALPLHEVSRLLEGHARVETFAVRIRPLSDVIDELGLEAIDLLKIDVERSEWDVLQGIRPQHWSLIRQLVVEVHDQDGRLQDTLALLQSHGLHCVVDQDEALEHTGLFNIYARRLNLGAEPTAEPPPVALHCPPLDELQMQAQLAQRLPAYMVPSRVLVIDELPLSANGKLDQRALEALSQTLHTARPRGEPPQGPTERGVASVWCELLGVDHVNRDDSFFDIGGHSLLALRMLQRLGKAFGQALQPQQLLAAPTVAGLAALLTTGAALQGDGKSALLLRGGQGCPLFLFAGAGGQLLPYASLLAGLRYDGPVYGLQRWGSVQQPSPSFLSVEAMAAVYLQEILALQPKGPYRLCGWSLGGLIASEVACLLRAGGAEVEFLGLIDSSLPTAEPLHAARSMGESWAERGVAETLAGLTAGQRGGIKRWLSALSELDVDTLLVVGAGRPDEELLLADIWAWASYCPTDAPRPTHCYCASQAVGGLDASLSEKAWTQVPGIVFHTVEGTHWSILEPDRARSLAQLLGDDLQGGSTAGRRSIAEPRCLAGTGHSGRRPRSGNR
jgi:nonribosomal peptide synthetase DhbF